MALYDICAVLTPCGPLKLLVSYLSCADAQINISKDREDAIPGLLYETTLDRSDAPVLPRWVLGESDDGREAREGDESGQKGVDEDIDKDMNKDIDKDIEKDMNKDIDKDVIKDANKDMNKDVNKDTDKDNTIITKDNITTNKDITNTNATEQHDSPVITDDDYEDEEVNRIFERSFETLVKR